MARWETLQEGVRVLRLWESIGPEWPQIAVLQLSSQRYAELRRNAKGFFDEYKIFPEPVQPFRGCTELLAAPKDYTGTWIVGPYHRWGSLARCAAFPAGPMERPKETK